MYIVLSINYLFICFWVVLVVGQNGYIHNLDDVLASREKSETHEVVRIVGGNPAYQGQFPYQVSCMTVWEFETYNNIISTSMKMLKIFMLIWMQVSMQVDSRHICGGSIYDQDTVITAAHCCKAVLEWGLDES